MHINEGHLIRRPRPLPLHLELVRRQRAFEVLVSRPLIRRQGRYPRPLVGLVPVAPLAQPEQFSIWPPDLHEVSTDEVESYDHRSTHTRHALLNRHRHMKPRSILLIKFDLFAAHSRRVVLCVQPKLAARLPRDHAHPPCRRSRRSVLPQPISITRHPFVVGVLLLPSRRHVARRARWALCPERRLLLRRRHARLGRPPRDRRYPQFRQAPQRQLPSPHLRCSPHHRTPHAL